MLVRIPYDRNAERVAKLLVMKMESLPEFMRKSVTWDQGKEMARHADFSVATGIDVAIHLGISVCRRDHGKVLRDN